MTLDTLAERRWPVASAALAGVVAAVVLAAVVNAAMAEALLRENGPVEVLSALLHFAAMALAIAVYRRAPGLMGLIAIAAFLMGMRELDWHKALTTHGVFSTKLYFRDYVPLAEKLIAGTFVIVLLVLLVVMLVRSRHDIRRLIADRAPALWGLATLVVWLPLLKIIDGLPRMMAEGGRALDSGVITTLLAVEEIGEMVLPVLVMLATWQVVRAMRSPLPQQLLLPI
jgi:hypothetical protein